MTTSPRVARLADVAAERLDLCDFLETLDDRDWQVRSLCAEWTVHDVLAHLTLSHRQTLRATLAHAVLANAAASTRPRRCGRRRSRPSTPPRSSSPCCAARPPSTTACP